MKQVKKVFLIFFVFIFLISCPILVHADEPIETYSPSCLLMELNTGKILYEKNINEKMYPASTTKLMTAILAVENCKLDDIATVSYNAISIVPDGYSTALLKEGEEVSIENLLNVMLVPSANDAANVVAEHVSGSIEEFAKLMNKKAKELGLKNSSFTNPSGIHDDNHYTTAYDLAIIGRYAAQNKTIADICSKASCSLPSSNAYSGSERFFYTTNELLLNNNYYYEYATGMKTGFTAPAGDCIVATANKDGVTYLAVVLGGDQNSDGSSQRYLDCKNLFEYGFNNYSLRTVSKKDSVNKQIEIWGATEETKKLDILVKDNISIFLKNDVDLSKIKNKTNYRTISLPITKGDVVGDISYTYEGVSYTSDLVAGSDVVKRDDFDSNFKILILVFLVIVLWICLKEKK